MSLIDALNWRYAVKKMNGQPVEQEKVDKIIAAAHLAPTSSGLQPFKVIVVTNQELKEKIAPIAYNQSQIIDSSHLLIFAANENYTEEGIDAVFTRMNAERGLPQNGTDAYKAQLKGMILSRSAEENFNHAARQAYIGFGVAIAEAALLKVDATPMEGFNGPALDELLGLDKKGLRSVTLLPLGHRDEAGDWLVNLKKVRSPKEEFLIELN
ncbi:NAD(P)H-dependent oxidoreductase [Pedobacter sp. HDW13]|uniref:nitroreductase family protein n=1 Tax=unclassified Pedobacter TaxID=2628915 RepID=UPI000F59B74D|nr:MULTISPECIES: nitroreductase family protein [unclassified Pedobacter]QIL38868.1 NAD(P)H-dependent oxidoreductase [Pedobacter sp. HDW13]RQO67228.1 NAD(P)H-dependent oxidoreductase [Pedobacter sp. KBW01]